MSAATRAERHLGWVTVDSQRYPRQKAEDWLDAVTKGLCPFCGEGPFTVVALHVAQVHDLTTRDFREALGIGLRERICDANHSKALSEHVKARPGWAEHLAVARTTGRVAADPPTHCPYGHEYSADRPKRQGCRLCDRDDSERRRRRMAERLAADDPSIRHGKQWVYRGGCRCAICVAAQRTRVRDAQRKRRLRGDVRRDEVERRLAAKLGVPHDEIRRAAEALWCDSIVGERDRRVGTDATKGRKSHATRILVIELRAELERPHGG